MKKKECHTGFRNEELFCFHCGRSMKMPMPMTSGMFSAITKEFGKEHKNCEKTWVEPVATPKVENTSYSIRDNAMWWLSNGEHGTSSKTMFRYLGKEFDMRLQHESEPSDPDDFRRCYLLLKAVPQWKNELHKLKHVSPTWSNLVDNWGKLTEMLEEQMQTKKANGMYEFMKTLGC